VVIATAGTPKDENVENRPKSGLASLPTSNALAAHVERPCKDESRWRNPTKVLKTLEPLQERKLEAKDQEPAKALGRVKANLDKPANRIAPRVQRMIYLDRVRENAYNIRRTKMVI
jgi:hypothetical protein